VTLVPRLALPGERSPVRVELLIVGAGESLYARFGHAALRVRGPARSDVVYNFGYTNFASPGLVFRFIRGEALFWVDRESMDSTVAEYVLEDRSVYRYPLNLPEADHADLARLLAWNAAPAHRTYVYHHFRDNCATRLRDLLDRAARGAVRQTLERRPMRVTLREFMREGFSGRLDLLLLSDLLVGRAVDRPITEWQGSFLPRILGPALRDVALDDARPLAAAPEVLYRRRAPLTVGQAPHQGRDTLWAAAALFGVLGAGLCLACRARSRTAGAFLLAPALVLGSCGLLVSAVALLSPLPELRWNENLLLLWPTDLLLAIPAVRFMRGRLLAGPWLRVYAGAHLGAAAVAGAGRAVGLLCQQPQAWLALALVTWGCVVVAIQWLGTAPQKKVIK
jgi:hypothetical protein